MIEEIVLSHGPMNTKGLYAVFSYNGFYPYGGWNDFQGTYPSIKLARKAIKNSEDKFKYHQIVDLNTEKICVKITDPELSMYT